MEVELCFSTCVGSHTFSTSKIRFLWLFSRKTRKIRISFLSYNFRHVVCTRLKLGKMWACVFRNDENTVNPLSLSQILGCGSQSRACTRTATVEVGLGHYLLLLLLAHRAHTCTQTTTALLSLSSPRSKHTLTAARTHAQALLQEHKDTYRHVHCALTPRRTVHIHTKTLNTYEQMHACNKKHTKRKTLRTHLK